MGALVKSRSRSFGQRQQELWSKAAAGALVKGSRTFGQRQQKLWSKAARALVKAARAMALEDGKVRIEKFDGSDFEFWKMQIEDYLYQKKLYLPLTGQKPTDMEQAEWDLLDRQTLGVIRLTLAKNVAFNIMNENTTVDLMKALSNMYEKPSAANKVYLIRRLVNLKMGEGNSITNHISEFNTIIT